MVGFETVAPLGVICDPLAGRDVSFNAAGDTVVAPATHGACAAVSFTETWLRTQPYRVPLLILPTAALGTARRRTTRSNDYDHS